LVEEHANLEHDTARAGYAHRQLFELIQNSANALAGSASGRISLKLLQIHLYGAGDGQAMSQDGVRALMFPRSSPKRGPAELVPRTDDAEDGLEPKSTRLKQCPQPGQLDIEPPCKLVL